MSREKTPVELSNRSGAHRHWHVSEKERLLIFASDATLATTGDVLRYMSEYFPARTYGAYTHQLQDPFYANAPFLQAAILRTNQRVKELLNAANNGKQLELTATKNNTENLPNKEIFLRCFKELLACFTRYQVPADKAQNWAADTANNVASIQPVDTSVNN